jgi:hypothetical protein
VIAYVLNNWRRHREDLAGVHRGPVDLYSSGVLFDGWKRPPQFVMPQGYEPLETVRPQTFLLSALWRQKHALIDPAETPGSLV